MKFSVLFPTASFLQIKAHLVWFELKKRREKAIVDFSFLVIYYIFFGHYRHIF